MTTPSRGTIWSSVNAMAPSLACPTGNQKEAVIALEKTRMATPTALNGQLRLVLRKEPGKALPEQENLPASNAIPDGGRTPPPKEKFSLLSGVVPAAGSAERFGTWATVKASIEARTSSGLLFHSPMECNSKIEFGAPLVTLKCTA